MLLTPTMMLARLEHGALDSPTVNEAFEVIVIRHGREVLDRIKDLLASLAKDRSGIVAEIATLIHASQMQDKRA